MIILDSHIEGAQEFSPTERGRIYRAIIEYLYYDREPDDDLKGAAKGFFIAIRPNLDVSKAKAEAGRKGGKARSKRQADAKQNASKSEAERGISDKQTPTEEEEEREVVVTSVTTPPIPPEVYAEIIGYLNERAVRSYKPTSEATRKLIRARLAEGFTVDDFKRVIDNKCASWLGDPKMDGYLRPSTLFQRGKFEGYLNEKPKQRGGGEFDQYRD